MTNPLPLTVRAIAAALPAVIPHLSRQARIAFSIKADISDVKAIYPTFKPSVPDHEYRLVIRKIE
jgi:hypothetical protein